MANWLRVPRFNIGPAGLLSGPRGVGAAPAGPADATALTQWFDGYYPTVFKYAYLRLLEREAAAEVASQVFREAVKRVPRLPDRERSDLPRLYRLARKAIDERPRPDRNRRLSGLDDGAARTGDADAYAPGVDLRTLDRLSDDQREVVILRFFLSLPAALVAPMLGRSEAAVFGLQARALVSLRDQVEATHQSALADAEAWDEA